MILTMSYLYLYIWSYVLYIPILLLKYGSTPLEPIFTFVTFLSLSNFARLFMLACYTIHLPSESPLIVVYKLLIIFFLFPILDYRLLVLVDKGTGSYLISGFILFLTGYEPH